MAFDDYSLPVTITQSVAVLRDGRNGASHHRRRFPRRPIRVVSVQGDAHTDSEMAALIAVFEGAKGNAGIVNMTFPVIGAVTGRFVSSTFSWSRYAPDLNRFSFTFREDPRPY